MLGYRHMCSSAVITLCPVDEHDCEVGDGITHGRHLPVEDRAHTTGLGIENGVVDSVVAVHKCRHRDGRDMRGQPCGESIDVFDRFHLRELPLLAPPCDLTLQVALCCPATSYRRIDRMQGDQRVDQRFTDVCRTGCTECACFRRRSDDLTVDVIHDHERRAGDGRVLAQRSWRRDREVDGVEHGEHAMLASHVVCARQNVAQRRAPQHELSSDSVLEAEGEVRASPGQQMCRERTGHVNLCVREPRGDRFQVERLGGHIHGWEPMGG